MSASVERLSDQDYVIQTDLPPEWVDRIGLEIFKRWVDFALGGAALNNRRIVHPTGRYAASIQYQQHGESEVAIVADASAAPEASILETGHGSVDLKQRLRPGVYAMHRTPLGRLSSAGLRRSSQNTPGGAGAALSASPSARPSMWAEMRSADANGFATLSPNSPPGSWIIPAMPAYSPAMALADMAGAIARGAHT